MMPGSSGPWSLNLRLKSSCDAAYESEEEEAPVMSPILPAQRFRRCLEPLVYQLKCSKAVSYTHLDVYKRQRSALSSQTLQRLTDDVPSVEVDHADERQIGPLTSSPS